MHFARIANCNKREMIAEVQSYIFRNRSRCQVLTQCAYSSRKTSEIINIIHLIMYGPEGNS